MKSWTAWLSLFASSSTLICCALPSLLVSIGMGAAMAGLVSSVPQIVWFSEYKILIFTISGMLLLVSFVLQKQSDRKPCPIDPKLVQACIKGRLWSKRIFYASIILWLLGAFFAFIAPNL